MFLVSCLIEISYVNIYVSTTDKVWTNEPLQTNKRSKETEQRNWTKERKERHKQKKKWNNEKQKHHQTDKKKTWKESTNYKQKIDVRNMETVVVSDGDKIWPVRRVNAWSITRLPDFCTLHVHWILGQHPCWRKLATICGILDIKLQLALLCQTVT